MIWFFHSSGTETSFSRTGRATANSAPVDIRAAATRKIPSNRGFSISNLTQGMTGTRPRTLLRRRSSPGFSVQVDRAARTARATASETRMSAVDVRRFYHQINTGGRDERAKRSEEHTSELQ